MQEWDIQTKRQEGQRRINMVCIVDVAEELFTYLYNSSYNLGGDDEGWEIDKLDIPPIFRKKVRKALVAMQTVNVAPEAEVAADLYGGEIVLEKLATL